MNVLEQLPLGVRLRDSSRFESYFAGRNVATVEALRAVRPGEGPTCIWLHGPAGSGKTHLLQAICALQAQQGARAAYVPLAECVGGSAALLSGYGELDCVCLDDGEALGARRDWEHAAFRLYQELDERRGHLIVASARPPGAAGIELRDLASRLGGGLTLTLQALEEAERIAALTLRAAARGFELPADAAQFLMRRLPRDMTTLCAFLDELDEASLAAQRRLTVPFVREVAQRWLARRRAVS